MTSKGQVTIPKRVRDYLGLKPGSDVEFQYAGPRQVVVKAAETEENRLEHALEALRGVAGPGMSTDEVMRLTRGWGEDDDLP
jgi:AbrB family looped-hinge helix DNA binding protein